MPHIPKDSLIVATRVSIGNVAINKIDVAISQDLTGITIDKSKTSEEYLYWTLLRIKDTIRSYTQGSTIQGLTREDLKNIKVPFPPFLEQQKISSILSKVDELIQKTDQIIEQTQRLKKGLLNKLFSKLVNDSPRVTVEQIKSSIRNAISMGPFGSNIKTDNFVPSGIPVIRGINLTKEPFNMEGFVFITEKKADELKSANAFPGDIVFTHRGTLGQVGIIPEGSIYRRFVISQSQMKLTCDRSKVYPLFVYYFFKSPVGQKALFENVARTGVPAIGQPTTTLRKIKIPLPSVDEQQQLASTMERIEGLTESRRSYRDSLGGFAAFGIAAAVIGPVAIATPVLAQGNMTGGNTTGGNTTEAVGQISEEV